MMQMQMLKSLQGIMPLMKHGAVLIAVLTLVLIKVDLVLHGMILHLRVIDS